MDATHNIARNASAIDRAYVGSSLSCFALLQRATVLLGLLLILPALAFSEPAGDASAREAIAKEIFFEVMSPFCAGRSLHDCPSGSATELKNEIRAALARGEGKEEILNGLVARFGKEVRAVPRFSGVGMLAWIAPLAFLLVGGVVIVIWLRISGSGDREPHTDTQKE